MGSKQNQNQEDRIGEDRLGRASHRLGDQAGLWENHRESRAADREGNHQNNHRQEAQRVGHLGNHHQEVGGSRLPCGGRTGRGLACSSYCYSQKVEAQEGRQAIRANGRWA